jgi:hypothetical protein
MSEAVETYTHHGVEVKLFPDYDCPSPRDCDGKIGEMFVSYPGYELGDTQLPSDGFEPIRCPVCEGIGVKLTPRGMTDPPVCERCKGDCEITPTIHEWLVSEKAIAAVPLFVYEHSGITMRTGGLIWLAKEGIKPSDTESRERFAVDTDGWDTSFVGFAVVREDEIKDAMGDDWEKHRMPEWVSEAVNGEVEEYARYLEGDCYGYVVADDTPFHDSCWGFIGFKYAKQEANQAAEHAATQMAKEREERAEWAARDVVTCG